MDNHSDLKPLPLEIQKKLYLLAERIAKRLMDEGRNNSGQAVDKG